MDQTKKDKMQHCANLFLVVEAALLEGQQTNSTPENVYIWLRVIEWSSKTKKIWTKENCTKLDKTQHCANLFWWLKLLCWKDSRRIPRQRRHQCHKGVAWQSFWLSSRVPDRRLRPFYSTGQNPSIWSGCEYGQRGNAQGPVTHHFGKLRLIFFVWMYVDFVHAC